MSKITDAVKQYQSAYATLRTTVDEALDEQFREFFEKNPEFRSIEWRQYTPSFNDGDPCRLIVSDIYHTLRPEFYEGNDRETIEEGDYEIGDLEEIADPISVPTDTCREYAKKWKDHSYNTWISEFDSLPKDVQDQKTRLYEAVQLLMKDITAVPDEIMEDIFGDNKAIRITKDGRQIEEYWCGY